MSPENARRLSRWVTFVVVRNARRPETLAQAIGADSDLHRPSLERFPTQDVWEIKVEGSGDDDISSMIESVLIRVRSYEEPLTRVCMEKDTACLLRVVQHVGDDPVGPGFVLATDSVALLARLGAVVDVDQYWVGCD